MLCKYHICLYCLSLVLDSDLHCFIYLYILGARTQHIIDTTKSLFCGWICSGRMPSWSWQCLKKGWELKGIQYGMGKKITWCFLKYLKCFNMEGILNLLYIISYSWNWANRCKFWQQREKYETWSWVLLCLFLAMHRLI